MQNPYPTPPTTTGVRSFETTTILGDNRFPAGSCWLESIIAAEAGGLAEIMKEEKENGFGLSSSGGFPVGLNELIDVFENFTDLIVAALFLLGNQVGRIGLPPLEHGVQNRYKRSSDVGQ